MDPMESQTRALIERIGKIENAHELTAWAKKHGPEIATLPEDLRDRVNAAGKWKRTLFDFAEYQCPHCQSIGFHAKDCSIASVAKEPKLKREKLPKLREHAKGCILAADHEGFCKGKQKDSIGKCPACHAIAGVHVAGCPEVPEPGSLG